MMSKKTILSLFAMVGMTLAGNAQDNKQTFFSDAFKHLDASVTLGTTGIGIDVASPLNDLIQVRAGFAAMPRFTYPMSFGVQVGDNAATSKSKFATLSKALQGFTGYEVDDRIDMIGKPTYWNGKLLVDVFPFQSNKHWHFTAGVFVGPSEVASAVNAMEDMSSTLAVGIYNRFYELGRAYNEDGDWLPITTIGDQPLYMSWDMEDMINRIYSAGRMAIHVGDYKRDIVDADGNVIHHKGDPYMMEPDGDAMVRAKMKVNAVKPYLGFGYGGRLFKGSNRYKVSFDAGVMFWGGTPDIYTHDGTNLTKDVENISGKVGDYVDLAKQVKAFPVLNVRFTRTIF